MNLVMGLSCHAVPHETQGISTDKGEDAIKLTYLLVLASEFRWGGLSRHHQLSWPRIFVISLVMFLGYLAHRGPQVKLARFESAGASTLHIHTLPFGFDPGDATKTQGIGVWSAEVCWLHRHLDLFVGQYVLNLLPSPGIPTLWNPKTLVVGLLKTLAAMNDGLNLEVLELKEVQGYKWRMRYRAVFVRCSGSLYAQIDKHPCRYSIVNLA